MGAESMSKQTFKVEAQWDSDADVWVATSSSVPGLVVEGLTKDEVIEKLRLVIPALRETGVERDDQIEIFFRPEAAIRVPLAVAA